MMKIKYCGFMCGKITEKQQEIVNELTTFKKRNPEYAEFMIGKLTDMLKNA